MKPLTRQWAATGCPPTVSVPVGTSSALAIVVLAVFAAPAAQHWQTGFLVVDAFLNHNTGSLFPLFPWFGFCADPSHFKTCCARKGFSPISAKNAAMPDLSKPNKLVLLRLAGTSTDFNVREEISNFTLRRS